MVEFTFHESTYCIYIYIYIYWKSCDYFYKVLAGKNVRFLGGERKSHETYVFSLCPGLQSTILVKCFAIKNLRENAAA